ncbi:hypothetical protein [Nocardiopsis suaedae]|uniref:Lipoprotein n=1 Tax=Nocardiopsis suaedae TaxID=3018444 RepID=A0ABT4THU8_9ACTN|nr:hypothetical protein [Nocardiopsis suaedae]MDA2804269.1 hypothetical protein [Nocardiopsis suaedae]
MFTELFAVGAAFLGMVLLAACSTPGRAGAEPEEDPQGTEPSPVPARPRGAGDAEVRPLDGGSRGRHAR